MTEHPGVIVPVAMFFLAICAPVPAVADADVEALLGTPVAGFDKPQTTHAGPVVLELSTTFPSTFWIKAYLPGRPEFRGGSALSVSISHVRDSSGTELYDPANRLESEFFQHVALGMYFDPAPHLEGLRTVNLRQGASTSELASVQGTVKLMLGIHPKAASFAAADIGKTQTVNGDAITLRSFSGSAAELHAADWSRLVAVTGYGADGKPVQTGMGPGSGGAPRIMFQRPAARVEVQVAESFVRRELPFTLTKAAGAAGRSK